jgi:phage terminase large subunit GpA-like protein
VSQSIDGIGRDWLRERVSNLTDAIVRVTPVTFNEANRYLPQGVSPRPGFIRYDLFPYLREILEAFDPCSPVREVNLKKGVQTGYTTLLESVLFYYIGHVTTSPVLYITADKELAKARIENNILPMLTESDMMHRIRSADVTNTRKTGQTDGNLQWDGGGFLIYNGAQNAAKMRQFSMPLILKDELDGWPSRIGKDGDPDSLTDDRASAYWSVRKILRGSTPTEKPSMIDKAFLRGDQRVYRVLCRACNAPQELRMDWQNTPGGFRWELDVDGTVVMESVRYCCNKCGHAHYETDKEKLFSAEEGAHWHPTATPVDPDIRSYHLPAFYSPFGFRPWSKNVIDFLEAYDPEVKQVIDLGKFQVFYNNVLGEAFEVMGGKVHFVSVSGHRRYAYRMGEVPNTYAKRFSGSAVLFLTCFVDVHDSNLAVGVMGWCRDMRCYLIDYWRFERGEGEVVCSDITSPAWGRLQTLLEETIYTADDGSRYNIAITLVDAGYETDTVTTFCSMYAAGVYPSLGRDRPAKYQTIKEFAEYQTQQGTTGYRILVDHYKDRLAPVLRREWVEEAGEQKRYHFNAPIDLPDKALKELTVETRRERTDERGQVSHYWHRPGNARNELWDILVGGHASAEILAWSICIQYFELDTIDWGQFWDYIEQKQLFFTGPSGGP